MHLRLRIALKVALLISVCVGLNIFAQVPPRGVALKDRDLSFVYEDDKNLFYLISSSLKPFQDSGYAFSFDVRRDYKVEDKNNPQDIGLKEHFLVMCDRNTISTPSVIHLRGDGMLGRLDPPDFSKGMTIPEGDSYQRKVLDYVCVSQLGDKFKKVSANTKPQQESVPLASPSKSIKDMPLPIVAPPPSPPDVSIRSSSLPIVAGQILPMVEISNAITLQVSAPTMFSDQTTVTLRNKNPIAYTVKLLVFNKAMDTETIGEKIVAIGPNAELEVKVPPLVGKSYSTPIFVRGFWKMGDYNIAKDSNGFWIPISNAKVEVCQSPDGPLSTHKPTPNAIDFCAPLGSIVVAAKDGIVVELRDKYTEGGPDPKFYDKDNKVSIYHVDGSASTYGHLAPKSIKVQLGQRVKAGEQLGQVGMTGQTSGPHVHFMVTYWDDQFREIFLLPTFISPENKPIPITYKAIVNSGGVIREGAKGSSSNTPVSPQNMTARGAEGKCGNASLDGLTRANDCYLTQNYPAAIEVLNQYIKQNPSNGRAVAMLALSYSRSGQHASAIPLFQKAISMGRTTYDVYGVYAMSLDATGNIDEAIKMNQQALKIVPGLIDVTRNLYREYMSKGMKSEALALVEAFDANQLKIGRPQYFQNEIAQAK